MHDGWRQMVLTPDFLQTWEQNMGTTPAPRAYAHRDGRLALMGREPVAVEDVRWHLSIRWADPKTNAGRVPTWEEMVNTVHDLRPGVAFVVGIPPASWWLNVHPDVLHAWETRDPYLVAQWRAEARGDRVT
jgi:hypothetical protein